MNESTAFVFVCSPNYWRYLFLALRSLLCTNDYLTQVIIYLVGNEKHSQWLRRRIRDSRVNVVAVPDIGGGYWHTNKTHFCDCPASRVVYLDVDVAVLGPIERLWIGHDEDLLARPADITYKPQWKQDKWEAALKVVGAASYPFYSPGFMILQNGAHRRIGHTWRRVTNRILNRELPLPSNRFAEMYAFSIAASLERLTHYSLPEYAHRYAYDGEPHEGAVVWHLGMPGFFRYWLPLDRAKGWSGRSDILVPVPRFLRTYMIWRRLRHKFLNLFVGPRSQRLSE